MKTTSLVFIFIISFFNTNINQAQNNPDFFLATNGITCMCPNADFGDTGTLIVEGQARTFTKRTESDLRNMIISNYQNPEIGLTCTSGITDMSDFFNFLFNVTNITQNIHYWDVSNVTNMSSMFNKASTDKPIGYWDVSQVVDMSLMFRQSYFNQPINDWDVSNVTSMNRMFSGNGNFNQPLNNWNIDNVEDTSYMFNRATSFNQPLDNWNVSNVSRMEFMFNLSLAFNQDISTWNFDNVLYLYGFLNNTSISINNYEALLQSFDNQNLLNLLLDADGLVFCNEQYRSSLIDNKGWFISGDIKGQCGGTPTSPSTTPFVTTWTVFSSDKNIDIYTIDAYDYDFEIDWGDGNIDQNVTSSITHQYTSPGTYIVSITGVFPYFKTCEVPTSFYFCGNAQKLKSVESWGDQKWISMLGSFRSTHNLKFNTTQAPNLTEATSLKRMFFETTSFNEPINHWNISNINDLSSVFSRSVDFNQPLDNWDVSSVKNMFGLFDEADNFNQPIGNWDTSNVIDFSRAFAEAQSFNHPINNWNVSKVKRMLVMFSETTSFNQPLDNWDVSNVFDMDYMFFEATSFNQDISMWCVEQIPQQPSEFAQNSALQSSYFPNWGAECDTFSVNDDEEQEFKIYPNPVQDILNISFNSQHVYNQFEIIVYDLNGKIISNQTFNQISNQIDFSMISSGIYFIQIKSDNISLTKRIIKQ